MSLTEQIQETFRRVSLQREAAHGLKGEDWERYREIQDGYGQKIARERAIYSEEYDTRVEAASKALINRAGAKERSFLPRFLGVDRFQKAEIDRQAHRAVRQDHARTVQGLEDAMHGETEELLKAAEQRGELGRKTKREFATATDRRSGTERRRRRAL